ncbi:MAG: hypothetical protein XD50_1028 [Clostridia bacterium 41_269]|nr:MAG: hypothetical protein XD50_1028 [Clostridia bacterium 41_269]
MVFKVMTPQGVRIIGRIEGNTLIKTVKRSKHFHRKTKSWGIQLAAIPQLEQIGVTQIRLNIKDTGEALTAPLQTLKTKGFVVDYGYGKQLLLPEKYWEAEGVKQLNLFEGVALWQV